MNEAYPYYCESCDSYVRFGAIVEDMDHRAGCIFGCRCESFEVGENPMLPESWVLDMDKAPVTPAELM